MAGQPAAAKPSSSNRAPPFRAGQMIVAIARSPSRLRQRGQRFLEHRVVAFVGEQPHVRQRSGATGIAAAIARAHAKRSHLACGGRGPRGPCLPRRGPQAPGEVTLVAVSKTHPAEAIAPLIEAGQRVFGENRVQEAEAKWPALRERHPDVELHLVGQLQSNKAEDAVALFDAIHSLDRPSLVAALARAMDKAGRRVPCFVQVNIGAEEQKGGCPIGELPALLAEARAADIPLAGLMCVPPLDDRAGAVLRAARQAGARQRPGRPQHGHERRFRDRDHARRHPRAGRHGACSASGRSRL